MLITKKINVTLDHIKKATELCKYSDTFVSECCPVALACQDVGLAGAKVGLSIVVFDNGSALLPSEAKRLAYNFDTLGYVEPTEFSLDIEYMDDSNED